MKRKRIVLFFLIYFLGVLGNIRVKYFQYVSIFNLEFEIIYVIVCRMMWGNFIVLWKINVVIINVLGRYQINVYFVKKRIMQGRSFIYCLKFYDGDKFQILFFLGKKKNGLYFMC